MGCPLLTSLDGAPEHVGGMFGVPYKPDLPLLRTLVSREVYMAWQPGREDASEEVAKILNDPRWVGQGKRKAMLCAAELIKAGFGGNARW
jgi:hypothetical protein